MTYAAYKCHLRRMQPSVWETAIDVSFFAVDDADISLHPPHHHQVSSSVRISQNLHPQDSDKGWGLRQIIFIQLNVNYRDYHLLILYGINTM